MITLQISRATTARDGVVKAIDGVCMAAAMIAINPFPDTRRIRL